MRTTIELGHSLGLRVVAEGVEDADTYESLVAFGCDLAQGYFLCEPKPADQLSFPSPGSRPRNVRDLRSPERLVHRVGSGRGTRRGLGRLLLRAPSRRSRSAT